MRFLSLTVVLILPVLAWAAARGQAETGFLNRTLVLDGRPYRYQVYVPAGYADVPADSAMPVILFLHGSGERGTDGLLQTEVGLGSALRRYSSRYPAIVVFPQAPPDSSWHGIGADIALGALERTEREFGTDPHRVYLAGMSMGGNGAWYLAYRHPERFAAVLVACGRVLPGGVSPRPLVPQTDGPYFEALALKLRTLPVWIFQGDHDPLVPVEESRQLVAALRALGADVHYTEIAGGDHNAWDAAFGSLDAASWLMAQRRH